MNLQFQPPIPYVACFHETQEQQWVSTPDNPNYPVGSAYSSKNGNWVPWSQAFGYPVAHAPFWELRASRCLDCGQAIE